MAAKITFGNSDIAGMYVGSSEVQSVWYGTTKVYEKSGGGGYTVSGTLTWDPDMGEDYAGLGVFFYEGDVTSQIGGDIPADYYYDNSFDYDNPVNYSTTAEGTTTIIIKGGLSAVVTSASINGSPLTFTDYSGTGWVWYAVVNITGNTTINITGYGYD